MANETAPTEAEAPAPSRPVIACSDERVDLLANEAEDAIIASGLPVFQRGRELVRPAQFDVPASKGRMTVSAGMTTLSHAGMVDTLAKAADWHKFDGRKKIMVPCRPHGLAADILLSRAGQWRLSSLAGIITAPTLRPDGSRLTAPGYDRATRLYHSINPNLTPEYVPDTPTSEQARAALDRLDDLLDEFPFSDSASRSVALSGLMTPILRGAIPVAPLHVAKANTAGTGKSYLIDLISAIASGRACPVIAVSEDAKETESRINGLLLGGFPLISLDNVNGELGGDLLAQAVTQPVVQVRRLGGSDIFEVESRATWFATGNGIRVKGDMTRRTVVCNIDAGLERPEMRQFAHSPLDEILNNRGRYIAAVLTIARAYLAAGRPGRLPAPASFQEWSDLVRSPLVWLGMADPWTTSEIARKDDPDLASLHDLLVCWTDAVGLDKAKPLREIIKLAFDKDISYDGEPPDFKWPDLRAALLSVAGEKGAINAKTLGKWLLSKEGRIVNDLRIKRGPPDSHAKVGTWLIENISPTMTVAG
jgi:putative DNA primase/helicase